MEVAFQRRMKYNRGHSILKKDINKVKINFDLSTLNSLCAYVISENKNIRRGALIHLRNLFEIMDLSIYNNDIEKMKRINFIRKGLEARILKRLKDPALIIKYINGGIIDKDLIDANNFSLLSNEELDWINETVAGALKYAFIDNDVDKALSVFTRFKACDYRSRGEIVKEIETLVGEMQNKFRQVRARDRSQVTFSLSGDNFSESLSDIYDQFANPNRKLYTGMQGFNELIGGSLESGRTYLFLGNAGTGKSNALLNLAVQIKKYNKSYKPKDPTRTPVVVYLTMENSTRESVGRLYSLVTGHEDMTEFKLEEVMHQLRTEGELYVSSESPIDIIIKYVPDKSVDTGYLYTLTEDLEDEGYEVICLIQDHIKRIRSIYPEKELRLELGNITNEFKTFAEFKDIPVISVSHLNRDGARTIDEGKKNNKYDLIRQLGRANTGESLLMIDNVDCAFLMGMEFDQDENKYMGFKRIKSRVKVNYMREYIAQPFVNSTSLKLVEDFYSKVPVFKDTLKPNISEARLDNNGLTQKQGCYNNIRSIDAIMKNNNNIKSSDDNIFQLSSSYDENTIQEIDDKTISPVTIKNRKPYIPLFTSISA